MPPPPPLVRHLHRRCVVISNVAAPPTAAASVPWVLLVVRYDVCDMGYVVHERRVWICVASPGFSNHLRCYRVNKQRALRVVAARSLRLPAWETKLAKSAGLYVYGMGRTRICVCKYVHFAVARRETWCGAIKDSGPSPLFIRKQEESIACCRSKWPQLPAGKAGKPCWL